MTRTIKHQKIADALGVDLDYVLELAGHRPPREQSAEPQNPRLSSFVAWVESAFHAMTAQEWDVREPAARALFSVPPIDANAHSRRPAKAARRGLTPSQKPDDNGDLPHASISFDRPGLSLSALRDVFVTPRLRLADVQ